MTDFTSLLEEVLEWVLTNKAPKLMLVWHKENGLWRDVNEFIALDYDTRTNDAGKFPDQNYFYDTELDPGDSVRSYFMMEGWHWALNSDWATSLEFVQKFGKPLYAVEGTIFGCGDDSIHWIRRTLGIKSVIAGFTLQPTLDTSHNDPEPIYIVTGEGDAVLLRVAIDDSKPIPKKP